MILPLFLYVGVCRFIHTVPGHCDEVLWDVLFGFHSNVVCVIFVPTDCEVCARCSFDVIEDAISDVPVLFMGRYMVFCALFGVMVWSPLSIIVSSRVYSLLGFVLPVDAGSPLVVRVRL